MTETATLLDRLRQAGSLSAQQLDYLRQRGFLPAADHAGPREEGWDDDEPFTDADDETDRHCAERRRGRRSSRSDEPRAEALALQLESLYEARNDLLASLRPLADVDDPAPAAVVRWLRQRTAEQLAGPLRLRLGEGTLPVARLWAVLDLSDFDDVPDAGPVATSYRALVRAARAGQGDLPVSYAWLLRQPAVAAAFDLLVTQRRLTEAASLVHRADAAVLRDGLRRCPHPLAFWTLLLLFNVDRRAGRIGKDVGSLRRVKGRPDAATWAKAWAQALLMNEAEAVTLLAGLHERSAQEEAPLYCPAAWGRLAFRYGG